MCGRRDRRQRFDGSWSRYRRARAGWTSVGARLRGSSPAAMVACVDDAEPLRAASEVRSDAGAALDASLADSETLRGELARLLAKAAPSADADARRAGAGVDEGEYDPAAEGALGAAEVDALVTRLRALHGARDACVRQMRVEGALREARVVADAVASSGVADRDATLDRLESAAGALAAAADALADAARDDAARDAHPPPRSRRDARSRSNPEPDPRALDPSDADDGASRLVFSASARLESLAHELRAPLEDVLAAAAASTGWPPPLNPAATESFRWPLADDEVVDPRRALPRAVAVADALERAAEGVPTVPSRGNTPTLASTASWASRALARPMEEKLRRHFGAGGVAASRPEMLFACASRAARALAPLARDRLLAAGAFDHPSSRRVGESVASSRVRSSVVASASASRRFAVGFAARLAVAAATVASDHHAASIEASESNRAANRTARHSARDDVPWLHLADECEAFDSETDALARKLAASEKGSDFRGDRSTIRALASVDAVERSALARLASTSASIRARWFAAELADAIRVVDDACDDPSNSGWFPAGVGVVGVGYEEGDPDPALVGEADFSGDLVSAEIPGNFAGDSEDGAVRIPAAEATRDAFRRAVARAAAIGPGGSLGILEGSERGRSIAFRLSSSASSALDASSLDASSLDASSLDARAAYLSEVAGGVADHFARRARRRVSADDAFGALANGDDGRAGALVVGACVAGVLRVAAQMSETQEEPETLDVAPDFFADRVAAAETLADEWTETLVDAAEDAYAEAAAEYEGGVHLLDFSEPSSSDARGPSSDALASPLETLRERLAGIRAATVLADASGARSRRAIRRLANRIADRTVREVALCAAFSRAGGERFARDVDAVVGAFGAYLRAPRVGLARAVEAAALLALDAERAAAFTTALGRRAKLAAEAETKANAGAETAFAEASTAVDAWREKLGVRNLGDELAFTILSRRTDMGASAER